MKQSQGFGAVAVIGLVAVTLLIGGVFFVSKNKPTDGKTEAMVAEEKMMMEEKMEEKTMMEDKALMDKEAMMDEGGEMMKKEDDIMMKQDEAVEGESMMKKEDDAMISKSGVYTAYSPESLAMAGKGKTVLFFHASWCPSCRGVDADIVKNVTTIPADVTILKVDYDKEIALKQKYGVTTQHTFVEVDASGDLVEKWTGGTLAGILAKL